MLPEAMRRMYLRYCQLPGPRRRRMFGYLLLTVVLLVIIMASLHGKKKQVWMFVVEEHHEVLRYWHHFGVTGKLNKTGNTLIHIDAHSDMAPPEFIDGLPFFQWPLGEPQLFGLMQKNDVFIQGAIMMGLITRVVWIYPSWDKSEDFGEHGAFRFDLGVYNITKDGETNTVFCECQTQVDKHMYLPMPGEKRKCHYLDESKELANSETRLRKGKCQIRKTFIMDIIVDDRAVELLQDPSWTGGLGDNVMLDMDEDYFGCERGSTPLERKKIAWSAVEHLNELINEIICAKNVLHEEAGDVVMKNLLAHYLRLCSPTKSGKCKTEFHELLSEIKKPVLEKHREIPRMFCHNSVKTTSLLEDITKALERLATEQVQAVMELGFCFRTSPATLGFEDGQGEFKICHGANTPTDTVVVLHTPKQQEIDRRMELLHAMLGHISTLDPKVVTLCRSVRDAYTPRHQAAMIEAGIMEYFTRSHDDVKYEIMYDDNLLGGELGWESRYQPIIN